MAEKKPAKIEETAVDYGEDLVTIKIPRNRNDESDVFVSVNERTWLIKRGVEVKVPACVAEVLRHAEEAEEEAYQFQSGNAHK